MDKPEDRPAKVIKYEFLYYSLFGLFLISVIVHLVIYVTVSTTFFLASLGTVFIALIYKVIEQNEEKVIKNKDNPKARNANSLFKKMLSALFSSFSTWTLIFFAIIALITYYHPASLVSWWEEFFVFGGTVLIGYFFRRKYNRREYNPSRGWEEFAVAFIIMAFIWALLGGGNYGFEKCIYDYKPYGPEAVDEYCDKFLL